VAAKGKSSRRSGVGRGGDGGSRGVNRLLAHIRAAASPFADCTSFAVGGGGHVVWHTCVTSCVEGEGLLVDAGFFYLE
jgi:hypothetical protein